jgi:hypothetical protein
MRTTLTLDDDVAIRLERMRKERDLDWKEIVNDVLRRGLMDVDAPKKRVPFRTQAVDLGPLLYPSIKDALRAMDEEYDRKKISALPR